MGAELFPQFRSKIEIANQILGYEIDDLCLNDTGGKLSDTQYSQPAIYVVNALAYENLDSKGLSDECAFAGHSLGEYNALLAAGVFDFETGLKLVKKRGELMAQSHGGAMAAILGMKDVEVELVLKASGLDDIDVANYNSPTQTVISGPVESIKRAEAIFTEAGGRFVRLRVSGAFHSRYMTDAKREFASFLDGEEFSAPNALVVANVSAKPYGIDNIRLNLTEQIIGSVRWVESIAYFIHHGVDSFEEVSGNILTDMVAAIKRKVKKQPVAAIKSDSNGRVDSVANTVPKTAAPNPLSEPSLPPAMLGIPGFRKRYGVELAYLAGGMYKGISSVELVSTMARAGMLAYFGAGGLSTDEIAAAVSKLKSELGNAYPWGVNLVHDINDDSHEVRLVDILLDAGVSYIEASAYVRITESLVLFRLKGLALRDGKIRCQHHILAKCSRPEVAEKFLSPAPEAIVEALLTQGKITEQQAQLAKRVPLASEICVEGDSGGHTDMGLLSALYPSITALKRRLVSILSYEMPIYVGVAGGIGTPEAIASSFMMGADFVLTGSINQCTVEAAQSAPVKDLLNQIDIQDTEYAPAGDMFDLGARVQVLKKGVLFPARANHLYQIYQQYSALEEIPIQLRNKLEEKYFKMPLEQVWNVCCDYYKSTGRVHIVRAAFDNPRKKMVLVFKYYFFKSAQYAREGRSEFKMDYQVHTGPALGAFNQWARGGQFENWQDRHVDQIAIALMEGGMKLIQSRYQSLHQAYVESASELG